MDESAAPGAFGGLGTADLGFKPPSGVAAGFLEKEGTGLGSGSGGAGPARKGGPYLYRPFTALDLNPQAHPRL